MDFLIILTKRTADFCKFLILLNPSIYNKSILNLALYKTVIYKFFDVGREEVFFILLSAKLALETLFSTCLI